MSAKLLLVSSKIYETVNSFVENIRNLSKPTKLSAGLVKHMPNLQNVYGTASSFAHSIQNPNKVYRTGDSSEQNIQNFSEGLRNC
jgi:hypothetical protein